MPPALPNKATKGHVFHGDNRDFSKKGTDVEKSSRAWQKVTVRLCSNEIDTYDSDTGESVRGWEQLGLDLQWHKQTESAKADPKDSMAHKPLEKHKCSSTFKLLGYAKNPLIPFGLAPAIDWDVMIHVKWISRKLAQINIAGSHDAYPAHEILANDVSLHKYDPRPSGKTAVSLAGAMDVGVNIIKQVPIDCPCCDCENK